MIEELKDGDWIPRDDKLGNQEKGRVHRRKKKKQGTSSGEEAEFSFSVQDNERKYERGRVERSELDDADKENI